MTRLFYLLSALLLTSLASAAEDSRAAEALTALLKPITTLEAQFTQVISDAKGEVLQQASGQLTVMQPRKLHWLTQQPYEHLVVTNGEWLWLYDIDLEQASRQPFSADLDKTPALLLSGNIKELSRHYQIVKIGAVDHYQLLPIDNSDSVFKQLSIRFNDGQLAEMTLHDSFDQTTVITFSDLINNPTVPESLFEFTPPEGIDVIIDES